MKIIMLSHEYPPKAGGAGVVANLYIEEFVRAGHQITLLTSSISEKQFVPEGVESRYVKQVKIIWPLLYVLFYLKNLKLFLNTDKIVINDMASIYWTGLVFSKKMFKKSICMVHGIEKKLDTPSLLDKLLIFRRMITRSYKQCASIIAVSEYIAREFFGQLEKDELINKTSVVYSPSHVDGACVHETIPVDTKNKIILTVSRLEKGKGFDLMLESLKTFNESEKDWLWLIVGDGAYSSTFRNAIPTNLKNKIKFTGSVEKEKLLSYYNEADVFFLLSQLKEAYGLVYVEALSQGVPIVAFNSGGPKEIVKNGINGYLVSDAHEAVDALKNVNTLSKKEILSTYDKFSKFVFSRKIDELFNDD
ncbi:glycosyltransferase family 4 protein [Vibrio parahaemolyticus]|uniref:glycosyltransferase family 4 protein n=1 Tax=Vibrio parahaemolyticus TaxID=670 RepID=UPI002359956B|nr:glycosyltransferase family 4 protein [Vibrio parahaemolyticus]WCZ02646.1 glycosyltransferase [Vibrio parahaemolyticus]WPD14789.1 glycosyltransferase family 4 protein [Vibrio parahaemolyticus]